MWPWKKRPPIGVADPSPDLTANATAPTYPRSLHGIPIVRFNPLQVTDEVKADISVTLRKEKRLSNAWPDIYPEAVLSVEEGRNLARLMQALQKAGWSSSEAGALTRHVHARATAIIRRTRELELGLREAVWLYSGAGCLTYKNDTEAQISLNAAHKAADGLKYFIAEGMLINGHRTWPGMDRHCRCMSKPLLPRSLGN